MFGKRLKTTAATTKREVFTIETIPGVRELGIQCLDFDKDKYLILKKLKDTREIGFIDGEVVDPSEMGLYATVVVEAAGDKKDNTIYKGQHLKVGDVYNGKIVVAVDYHACSPEDMPLVMANAIKVA